MPGSFRAKCSKGEHVRPDPRDLPATVDRLLEHGASVHAPVTERGAGFVTASVADPFGNVLGVMSNPNWVAHAARP